MDGLARQKLIGCFNHTYAEDTVVVGGLLSYWKLIMGALARSLPLHIKVVMEILTPLMVADVSLVDVCSDNPGLLHLKLSPIPK